jgi:rhodanese-related sulfurtransferase
LSFLDRLFGGGAPALDAATVQAKLSAQPAPFLLDVRQPHEFHAGHIAGATLIPLHELPTPWNKLPKDREIICVCRSGNRSGAAARQLVAAGYNAFNLRGGMNSWQRAGLPIKRGKG